MKVLGVGLSRTGTRSLQEALVALDFRSLHYRADLIEGLFTHGRFDFGAYEGFDAVTDLPAALFYREILQRFPACKAVLTIRDEDDWWRSFRALCQHHPSVHPRARLRLAASARVELPLDARVHMAAYGSFGDCEYLSRKRYREHNEQVVQHVPRERLLVMDITSGDGWELLCPFLGLPVPDVPFPHRNRHGVEGLRLRWGPRS